MKKKVLAVILAGMMLVNTAAPAMAETQNTETTSLAEHNMNVQEMDQDAEITESENVEQQENEETSKRENEEIQETEEVPVESESEQKDNSESLPTEDTTVDEGTAEEEISDETGEKIEEPVQTDEETEAVQDDVQQQNQKINNGQAIETQSALSVGEMFREGAVTYKVNEDNISCTIVETDRTTTDAIVIPQTVQGYKVTVVGAMAFEGTKFKNVQFPNGVTKIEHNAFENSELESIVIPDTVTEIGYKAFMECHSLVTVKLPAELKEISAQMFTYDEKLQNIIIPDKVIKIGFSAFEECGGLLEIVIPDSVEQIEKYAFQECVQLKKVQLPRNLKTIENQTFRNCEKLKDIVWGEKLEVIGDVAFVGCSMLDTEIPDGLKKIKDGAFESTGIAELKIPDSVTEVGEKAFQACNKLKSVKIGTGLKKTSNAIFGSCENLESVKLGTQIDEIGASTFYGCDELKQIFIPQSVNKIGDSAFWNTNKLQYIYYEGSKEAWEKIVIGEYNEPLQSETIKLQYQQKELADEAEGWIYTVNEDGKTCTLYGAKVIGAYENLVIDTIDGYTVTKIGKNAFKNDNNIKTVTLSENVVSVGAHAFSECENLHTLTLNSKKTEFEMYCFALSAGRNIKDIYYAGSVIDRKKYYGESGSAFGEGYAAKWHYASNSWNDFEYEYKINEDGNTCTIMKADVLLYGEVEVPEKIDGKMVTNIDDNAFSSIYSMTKVILPKGLREIGKNAFYDCSGLAEIVFNDSLEMIGERAFSNCVSLKEILLPENVTDIGDSAFQACSGAEKIVLPSKLKILRMGVFDCGRDENGTINLKEITLPKSLEKMEAYCISGSFEKFTIPGSVKKIESNALCSSEIKYLTISEGVEEIETEAFWPSKYGGILKAVILPKSIKKISKEAFDVDGLYVYYAGTEKDRERIENADELLEQAIWMYETTKIEDYNYTLNPDGSTVTIISSNIDLKNKIILPDMINGHKVTAIKAGFCTSNLELRQIVFPKYLEEIGENAFSWCTNLNMVQFPVSLTSIGQYAFDVAPLDVIRYDGNKNDREKMNLPIQEDNPLNCVEWVYNYGKTDVEPRPTDTPQPTEAPEPTEAPQPTNVPKPTGTPIETPEKGGWQKEDGKWYYVDSDTGNNVENTKKEISGSMYWFDSTGAMQTGWIKLTDDTGKVIWMYGKKDSGKLLKSEWLKLGTKWYYFKNYEMVTGVVTIAGSNHWFLPNGEWVEQVKNDQTGWRSAGTEWYYFEKGKLVTSTVKSINGKKYMFDDAGKMYSDCEKVVQTKNGSITYYFGKSGAAYTSQWRLTAGKKWKYYDNDGGEVRLCWKKIKGDWYYFKKNGEMQTGWLLEKGNWYYLNTTGKMQTGWLLEKGNWYYMDKNGVMQKSKWIAGTYYVKENGKMAVSEWVDQNRYYVNAKGEWVKGKKKAA